MSRASGTSVENNFVKGFLTEFSGFNFPENACEETLNCVFSQSGNVSRRLGLELEIVSSPPTVTYTTDSVYTSFVWKSAGYRSENSFVVHQIDTTLHFYKLNSDIIADSKASFTFNLNTYATSVNVGSTPCQFTNGSGRLFVSNADVEPFFITYNSDSDSISSSLIEVKIRDFKILSDGLAIHESLPVSTTNLEYLYNIRNQGWATNLLSGWAAVGNPNYPTKGQIWWYFRDPGAYAGTPPYTDFYPNNRYRYEDLGVSLAPRGRFVLNAFNQDRSSVSGLAGLETLTSRNKRPSCNAFINGRIFLSGVDADGYNGIVYFSNILKSPDTDIRFYQNGDPTAEANPQLLPNDGGTFVIPEAGRIIRMVPVKNSLVVFASNGVWTIQGNEGVGFTATDFAIEKISDEPCIANESFLTVSNFPIWWTVEGIFTLQAGNTGAINAQNLTKTTIQTFFYEIPVTCKRYVKSAYNTLTKEIFWLYSTDYLNPKTFNRVLVLNVSTQAFYVHTLNDTIKVVDIVAPPVQGQPQVSGTVVDSLGNHVIDSTANLVIGTVLVNFNPSNLQNVKFVIEYDSDKIGFAKFSNENLLDWEDLSSPGIEYDSYFITGPRVRGEGQRKFQESYITVYSKYDEDASCWIMSIWDYGNSQDSNKYGTPQQAIKPNSNFDFSTRRLKIRGNGKSVKYKFDSEGVKPFTILGWAAYETVNDKV